MIDYINRDDILSALDSSFTSWSSVVQLNFTETQDYDGADITIGFYYGDHGDGFPFTQGVLAHAFAPEIAKMHFNGAVIWSIDFHREKRPDAFDLESVATHEIGHLLGLDHSADPDAVMFRSIHRRTKKRELTPDDVQGIQTLYSQRPNYRPHKNAADSNKTLSLLLSFVSLIMLLGLLV